MFLIWRAPYGYSFNDEPFIVTLGQRLSYGDSLIVDEWHLVQLFAPVMLLFYKLFHLFSESNEGILLCFRYIYCVIWFGTCYCVYTTLHKKYNYAICIFCFLILFAPFDLMTLSYKSFGVLSGLLLSSFLFYCLQERVSGSVKIFTISFLISLFTLCCPYFGIFSVLIGCGLLIYNIQARKKGQHLIWDNRYIFICFMVVAAMATVYVYIFSAQKYGIEKVLESVKYLFHDPEHSSGLFSKVKYGIVLLWGLASKCRIYTVVLFVTFILSIFKKRFPAYRFLIFTTASLGYFLAIFAYLRHGFTGTFNYEIIDIALLGIIAFILLERKPWKMFLTFTLIGFIYLISDSVLSSNTHLYEVGMNSLIVGVSSIVYIIELCKELKIDSCVRFGRFAMVLCTVIISTQILTQTYTRLGRQFFDTSPLKMTETIEVGACKGLKTTAERKESYTICYNNLKTLLKDSGNSKGKFLSISSDPVVYLNAELPFGTFSAWTFGYKDNVNIPG